MPASKFFPAEFSMALRACLLPVLTQKQFADKALASAIRLHPSLGKELYQAQKKFLHLYFYLIGRYPDKAHDHTFLINQFLKNDAGRALIFPVPGSFSESARYSWPATWWMEGKTSWAEKWEPIVLELKRDAPLFIRTNLLLCSKEELVKRLLSEGMDVKIIPDSDTALILERAPTMFHLPSFHAGWWEVQDLHAQELAAFAHVKPGMRVIDGCAGAGGKSLAMAAAMQGKGKIIALDVHSKRLLMLRKRAARANAFSIETRLIQDSKVVRRLKNQGDLVLLDVPCSGSGVLRRNPDILIHGSERFPESLLQTQQALLEQFAPTVKIQGRLIYATCSLFKSEGEQQTLTFLSRHPGFKLLREQRWWPGPDKGDGFYAAEFLRLK